MVNYQVIECQKSDRDFFYDKLVEYNFSQVPPVNDYRFIDVSRKIVDENGAMIAGILGNLDAWGCLHVEILWIDMAHRKTGIGSKILKEVETISKTNGCYLVHLDTFDFQAKDFYLKNGYEIFGVLDDCPLGHKRYFLKKYL